MTPAELTRELDEAIVEAKDSARRKVAEELRALMREHLPKLLKRLKRDSAADASTVRGTVRIAIAETLIKDRKLAAGFFLRQIANHHLDRFMRSEIVAAVEFKKVVFPAEVIDRVMEACAIALTSYPDNCKPRLPRRSDVGRAVHRFCKHGRI